MLTIKVTDPDEALRELGGAVEIDLVDPPPADAGAGAGTGGETKA